MVFFRNRRIIGIVYALSLAGLGYLAWTGWSYYATPLLERPRHELYWTLKPGGMRGYLLGVAGTCLMILMHVYSLRRRIGALRGWGPTRTWLDFHIYCGVMGPALIIFHSSFKVGGLVGISFWSMIAVALSGVLGRYLYLQIPRRRSGDELSLTEIHELDHRTTARLREEFGVTEPELEKVRSVATGDLPASGGLVSILIGLPLQGLVVRRRVGRLVREFDSPSGESQRELLRVLRQKAQLERRVVLWHRLQQLFHHWHVFHKPFAVVMYFFAAVHIVVVFAMGYGGIPR